MFRLRQLPFLPEKVDELALAGMVRDDQLGQVAVRAEHRRGRERSAHEHVEVRAQTVERLGELLGGWAVGALRHLEPGREAHALSGPVD